MATPGREGGARDSLASYYDASQLRGDLWTRLRDLCVRAAESGARAPSPGEIASTLDLLESIECYFAFPGRDEVRALGRLLERGELDQLKVEASRVSRLVTGEGQKRRERSSDETEGEPGDSGADPRPRFEVLVVDDGPREEQEDLRGRLRAMRRPEDRFIYDVVVVSSFEDAVIAVLFNHMIQACVARYSFPMRAGERHELLRRFLGAVGSNELEEALDHDRGVALGRVVRRLRPELDLFLVTDLPLEELAGSIEEVFRRVFYTLEDYLELHLSTMKGIEERYQTPFFDALREYSRKPTGVFHALPISRGKSIARSRWIRDMGEFYGPNIFLAETSSTGGGLDSLLQPHGPLKEAQRLAARAFGAKRTYMVTNGTSTANKVVVQALVRPGDIVLLSRDCHKSHHYALMLAGALPIYLDPYPVSDYSMYGGVPTSDIVRRLRELQRAGQLSRVRMVLLTNCTFDGVVYDPIRVMREVLAIKPDMVFVWDEAWFAFARFNPTYRRRTAMEAAERLCEEYRSPGHRARFEAWRATGEGDPVADPDLVRVRVYATQSTHKTLTALRQGSMIHVHDQDFEHGASEAFTEAYMTHTSTSPNYQILASLDVGRRQVELEGYELVRRQLQLAMALRQHIHSHPVLRRYFRILAAKDLIPPDHRPSGIEYYYVPGTGWSPMEEAFARDEFVIDPTRVTVAIGLTGMDGDTFKKLLQNEYDIQINKTSRNSVLFMTHIGTSRGTIAYLVEVLTRIARGLDERLRDQGEIDKARHFSSVASLTRDLPPLPDFGAWHPSFAGDPGRPSDEGDMRRAFYLAYEDVACEHVDLARAAELIREGRTLVSASFVTPYPPGFPILVPGQVVSGRILAFLRALDVKEIHGYRAEYGLRIFTESALARPTLRESPTPARTTGG